MLEGAQSWAFQTQTNRSKDHFGPSQETFLLPTSVCVRVRNVHLPLTIVSGPQLDGMPSLKQRQETSL